MGWGKCMLCAFPPRGRHIPFLEAPVLALENLIVVCKGDSKVGDTNIKSTTKDTVVNGSYEWEKDGS